MTIFHVHFEEPTLEPLISHVGKNIGKNFVAKALLSSCKAISWAGLFLKINGLASSVQWLWVRDPTLTCRAFAQQDRCLPKSKLHEALLVERINQSLLSHLMLGLSV